MSISWLQETKELFICKPKTFTTNKIRLSLWRTKIWVEIFGLTVQESMLTWAVCPTDPKQNAMNYKELQSAEQYSFWKKKCEHQSIALSKDKAKYNCLKVNLGISYSKFTVALIMNASTRSLSTLLAFCFGLMSWAYWGETPIWIGDNNVLLFPNNYGMLRVINFLHDNL